MSNDVPISISTTSSPPSNIDSAVWSYTPQERSSKAVALPTGLFHCSKVKQRRAVPATSKATPCRKPASESDGWRKPEVELELNADLVGVKAALGVLEDYEVKVGFGGSASAQITVPDLSRQVDDGEVAVYQRRWKELMESIKKPWEDPKQGPCSEAQPSTTASVHDARIDSLPKQNISVLSGLDLAKWDHRSPVLSTPKPKVSSIGVECPIPRAARSCSSSPFDDNDTSLSLASSLSELKRTPTPPLSFSTDSSPKSSATSPSPPLHDFVFPSLSGASLPSKIHLEKDEQGFFTGVEETSLSQSHSKSSTSSLLPPFLLDESQKRKSSQSKTRTIVDRLKNDSHGQENNEVQNSGIALHQPRLVADVDGWIGVSEPYRPDQAMAERKREMFLAMNKPLDSLKSNTKPRDSSPKQDTSHSSSSSLSSHVSNDGWIEFVQKPPSQTKHSRAKSHNKRSSTGSSAPQSAPSSYTSFRAPIHSMPPPPPPFYYPGPASRATMPVIPAVPPVPYGFTAYPPPPAPAIVPQAPYVPFPMAPYSVRIPPPPLLQQHPRAPMTVYTPVVHPAGKVTYFPPLPSMVRPGSVHHPAAW
ncbi:hypothetical protein Moror_14735 [Moniliophthora roreri MCA 2997]|uniref:Uncharacterized protein n=2 Tax=Moniliophthora roreri TaxID=221103 RepID=V2WNI0_MONRO|nr:hypothetical protein Moror_14735 [Moniliophthora roreri MCA 2997]